MSRLVLRVTILKATNLVIPSGHKPNTYVELGLQGRPDTQQKTRIICKNRNPTFDEVLEIPSENPRTDFLSLEIFHKSHSSPSFRIANTIDIPFKQFRSGDYIHSEVFTLLKGQKGNYSEVGNLEIDVECVPSIIDSVQLQKPVPSSLLQNPPSSVRPSTAGFPKTVNRALQVSFILPRNGESERSQIESDSSGIPKPLKSAETSKKKSQTISEIMERTPKVQPNSEIGERIEKRHSVRKTQQNSEIGEQTPKSQPISQLGEPIEKFQSVRRTQPNSETGERTEKPHSVRRTQQNSEMRERTEKSQPNSEIGERTEKPQSVRRTQQNSEIGEQTPKSQPNSQLGEPTEKFQSVRKTQPNSGIGDRKSVV
jgi:hypothetical protein